MSDNIVRTITSMGVGHFSFQILDDFVAPKLSQFTAMGAPALPEFPNYFGDLLLKSVFHKKYKGHIHSLLVVFLSRIDFACNEYRNAASSAHDFVRMLPRTNSHTKHYRAAVTHFETCLLQTSIAVSCLGAICRSVSQPEYFSIGDGSDYDRIRLMANRIKHFDEDVIPDAGKIATAFPLTPIWLTNDGLESSVAKLGYEELRNVLCAAMEDAKTFVQDLSGAPQKVE